MNRCSLWEGSVATTIKNALPDGSTSEFAQARGQETLTGVSCCSFGLLSSMVYGRWADWMAMRRFTIAQKLTVATVLLMAVVVSLIAICTQYSIETGFSAYVAKNELSKVDSLVPLLERAYVEHGGDWGFAQDEREGIWQLIALNERIHAPRSATGVDDSFPNGLSNEIPGENFKSRPPFPKHRMELFERIGVFDRDDKLVWGNEQARLSEQSVQMSVNSAPIGKLKLAAFSAITQQMDKQFVAEQNRNLIFIAALGFVLAVICALAVSHDLLSGIKLLRDATGKLTAGKLSERMPVTRTDELGELASDFNKLAEALEQHEKAHRQFVADTSHELRTPIAILRAQVEALQDGIHSPSGKTLGVLHSEIMGMSRLVDDLYDLAKSDVGQLGYKLVPVDVTAVLDEAIDAFDERFRGKNITVDKTGIDQSSHLVNADSDRIKQLFRNIMGNSLRYTDSGGTLQVSTQVQNGNLHVYFDDTKPGVEESVLPQIFDRFVRAESSRNRSLGGAGLGLAICKSIIAEHGGSIKAAASALGGLRIEICLPLERSTARG
jgi:two-component system, OmpR family, sensor histidine kinase BaeS